MLINQAIDVGPEARPGAATASEARLFRLGDADSRFRSSAACHVPFPDGHGQAAYASREPREERSQLRKAGYGFLLPANIAELLPACCPERGNRRSDCGKRQ